MGRVAILAAAGSGALMANSEEYKVESVLGDYEKHLNQRSVEGWELAFIQLKGTTIFLVWKRTLIPSPHQILPEEGG